MFCRRERWQAAAPTTGQFFECKKKKEETLANFLKEKNVITQKGKRQIAPEEERRGNQSEVRSDRGRSETNINKKTTTNEWGIRPMEIKSNRGETSAPGIVKNFTKRNSGKEEIRKEKSKINKLVGKMEITDG